jgi:hypothetical protein
MSDAVLEAAERVPELRRHEVLLIAVFDRLAPVRWP